MTAESSSPTSPEKNYIAIIGDLRHSRRARSRSELQRRVLDQVDWLNTTKHKTLDGQYPFAAPVSMTAGDEVQVLFVASGELCPFVMKLLSSAARPAQFTFGVGFGTISTDLNRNVAIIDGPAFHNARSALEDARRHGFWAEAKGFGEWPDVTITALLGLTGAIMNKWTDRQLYFIEQMNLDRAQSDIATEEGISPSVVSESLSAAAFSPHKKGEMALMMLFHDHLAGTTP